MNKTVVKGSNLRSYTEKRVQGWSKNMRFVRSFYNAANAVWITMTMNAIKLLAQKRLRRCKDLWKAFETCTFKISVTAILRRESYCKLHWKSLDKHCLPKIAAHSNDYCKKDASSSTERSLFIWNNVVDVLDFENIFDSFRRLVLYQ